MYLWKYWRDTRLILALCGCYIALSIGISLWYVVHYRAIVPKIGYVADVAASSNQAFASYCGFLTLVAWILGQYCVGRDISQRSGTYLYVLPRSRRFFVWSDWVSGIASLAIVIVLCAMTFRIAIRCFVGVLLPSNMVHMRAVLPLGLALVLAAICVFLYVSLIFGVTNLLTVVLKGPTRGLIGAIVIFAAYGIIDRVLVHYYSFQLPSWLYNPYQFSSVASALHRAPHIALSLILRTVLLLAFPLAAQVAFERSDI